MEQALVPFWTTHQVLQAAPRFYDGMSPRIGIHIQYRNVRGVLQGKAKIIPRETTASVPDLLNYHQALYTSSIVARYLLTQTHMNQRIDEFADSYDAPFSENNPLHMEVLRGIGRYYHQMATLSKPEFQDAFNFTLARLNSTASLRESFDNFNASVGRRVTSTPPAPAPASAIEYQQSPIVEPRSPQDRFTNVPPYVRVGPTYENQRCQEANVPF
jgi:hypothetical protein